MSDQDVKRSIKGRRPQFSADPAVDQLHGMVMAMATEMGLKQIHADEMVQLCMVRPMEAKPLAWNSKELAALTAYVVDIQKSFKPVAGAANPCAAKNPCAGKNPCAAKKCGPKNPCAAKAACGPKNPCAAKKPCGPKNPCAAKNPCAPKNPCAAKK